MSEVRNNEVEGRYEFAVGVDVAIAAYQRRGGAVVFTHTQVPPELEGRGIGSALVKGALDDVRARGLSVIPACAFVAAYLERHPEEQDLLAG
jgi:predicted GNAT family acetyltransferase